MNATDVKVIDASALAAVMFEEPEADDIAIRLRGATLVAPALLKFEIVNVSLMKLRRHPDQRVGILQAFKLQGGLTFAVAEVDHTDVLTWARKPA